MRATSNGLSLTTSQHPCCSTRAVFRGPVQGRKAIAWWKGGSLSGTTVSAASAAMSKGISKFHADTCSSRLSPTSPSQAHLRA